MTPCLAPRLGSVVVGLRPDDPRQPYVQIADDLRDAIRTGDYEPGAQLPATRELIDKYGVASTTAQRALALLRTEGLVYSVQGRGTFVRTDLDVDSMDTPTPSPDFVRLMRRLDDLADEVRRIDERLTRIESGAGRRRAKTS
jgi:GntR family transcriptional regulator